MNIYEDEGLEQKLEELSDLIGNLVLDVILIGLRKAVAQQQIFKEFAEAKQPFPKECDPF